MAEEQKFYKVKVLHNEPFHMKFTAEYEYDFNPNDEVIVPQIVAEIMKQRWQGVFEVSEEITPEDLLKATKQSRRVRKSQSETNEEINEENQA